jgi:hypothetical protein
MEQTAPGVWRLEFRPLAFRIEDIAVEIDNEIPEDHAYHGHYRLGRPETVEAETCKKPYPSFISSICI